jgi:pimeloyl-ACP methyl ester carboxylesterase
LKFSWRVCLCAALAGFAACGASPPGASTTAGASTPGLSAPDSSGAPAATAQFATSADGVGIAWHRFGQGEPAIVLVHGWAANSSIWRAQLAVLAARYSVVTLDLAGQGASGANRRSWSLANFAQDVAAVVARLPDARIILVGQGMGGPVALEAAPLVGPRLRGIIGVETFRTIGQPPPLPSQLEQNLLPFRADFVGAMHRFVTATLFHPQTNPAVVRTVVELMAQTVPERGLAALGELNRLDYATILPALKTPIVVIDSDLGGAVDEARLHRADPQLRVITLSGDDSFPMLDDIQRFNGALLLAIDSLAAR